MLCSVDTEEGSGAMHTRLVTYLSIRKASLSIDSFPCYMSDDRMVTSLDAHIDFEVSIPTFRQFHTCSALARRD